MAAVILETARLRLRPWRDDDLDDLDALCRDPEVMEYLLPLADRAAAQALLRRLQDHITQHGFGFWAIELRDQPAGLIGFTGLLRVGYVAAFTPAVEIGWRLARRHWGLGYASEAAQAALAFGFERLHLPEIVALTVPANQRSRRVMERLGMSRTPTDDFDHPLVPAGHPLQRHVLYRLRQENWPGGSAMPAAPPALA